MQHRIWSLVRRARRQRPLKPPLRNTPKVERRTLLVALTAAVATSQVVDPILRWVEGEATVPPPRLPRSGEPWVLIMGDSIMSGAGAGKYYLIPGETENRYLSRLAGAGLAAEHLGIPYINVACAGSMLGNLEQVQRVGELVRKHGPPSTIIVNGGANDLGVSIRDQVAEYTTGLTATALQAASQLNGSDNETQAIVTNLIAEQMRVSLVSFLYALANEIVNNSNGRHGTSLPGRQVKLGTPIKLLLVGYPYESFPDREVGVLSRAGAHKLREVFSAINSAYRSVAGISAPLSTREHERDFPYGFSLEYVSTAERFADKDPSHVYVIPESANYFVQRWPEFVDHSDDPHGTPSAPYHPNASGQMLIGKDLLQHLEHAAPQPELSHQ